MTDNTPQMDSATDAGTGFESVIGDPSADTADASQAGGHRVFGSHRAARTASSKRTVSAVAGVIGEVLITLAVIVGFYLAWQMWWTGVMSQRTQASDDEVQTSSWTSAKSSDNTYRIAKANPVSTTPLEEGKYQTSKIMSKIYIPRFGAKWVRNIVEGTDIQQLNMHGLGHYSESQKAGAIGNFAVAGHRAGYGEPLAHIDDFKPGDKIVLRTQNYWYVYEYTNHEIVDPENVGVIEPVPNHPGQKPTERLITLTTCEPRYAYITAAHRWIAYGKLVSWSRVSEGVPKELASKARDGQVVFAQEEGTTVLPPDMSHIALASLLSYAVVYLAALAVWRYRGVRKYLGTAKEKRPVFSLYGWLTRIQPGPLPVRIILVLLLCATLIAVFFQWGYPWMAQNLPFLQLTSNYVG